MLSSHVSCCSVALDVGASYWLSYVCVCCEVMALPIDSYINMLALLNIDVACVLVLCGVVMCWPCVWVSTRWCGSILTLRRGNYLLVLLEVGAACSLLCFCNVNS